MTQSNGKRTQARGMRKDGKTYDQIGAELNVTRQRAHQLVNRKAGEITTIAISTTAANAFRDLATLNQMTQSEMLIELVRAYDRKAAVRRRIKELQKQLDP